MNVDEIAFIGIDPGVSGGIAILTGRKSEIYKCPATVRDMADILEPYRNKQDVSVGLERVHSMPGQGVASTFKFGMNYGQWLGILASMSIPYKLIQPYTWMKYYSYPKDRKDRKNYFKNVAQQRVPLLKVTLAHAAARLIAYYTRGSHTA